MVAGLPPGVEAVRRGDTLVLLNHNAEAVAIDAGPDGAALDLPGCGVLLRERRRDSPQ